MGYGGYSVSTRATSGRSAFYASAAPSEIFKEVTINSSMNPKNVKVRESRDSKEHPNSVAIVLALDVTGSMGSIPHHLVKEGLPDIMDSIIKSGIKDPQLLFVGIGDHECDKFPLQVSQFESNDELLDKWLTDLYLEGGGGGNSGESYILAWYFAGKHTAIDCFEKRKQKGFLFTVGDEDYLKEIPRAAFECIMGSKKEHTTMSAPALLEKAKEQYNVYHILVKEGSEGSEKYVYNSWKQLLGKNLIVAEKHQDIPKLIVDIIKNNVGKKESHSDTDSKKEDIIL